MATRCNVIVTDEYPSCIVFYRHWDGYPEGTGVDLVKFLERPNLRDNASQAAGWLIVHGRPEGSDPTDWKVGDYEPTDCIHGDVEYVYVVNVHSKTVTMFPPYEDETADDYVRRAMRGEGEIITKGSATS